MRVKRPLLLLLAALTAGCAETEPFVYPGNGDGRDIAKPRDTVLTTGQTAICYGDKIAWTEVMRLATEECARYGLRIHSYQVTRWNCRASAPHEATFRCFDPEMVTDKGVPVNVFSEAEVAAWEKRTGKKAKPHNNLDQQILPPAAATTPPAAPAVPAAPPAPPAAPVTSAPLLVPLTPADIAGRPPMPSMPPQAPAPAPTPAPAQGAYPADGFTLPQGSWGDHFQE